MGRCTRLKVVVIGGGIAGAELVRNASSGPLELTLIEPKEQIECQALYPEYLAGSASLDDLTAPLRPFCERIGAELINESAVCMEAEHVICDKSLVEYDVAVIATGAAQNYFGIKGAENTFSVGTLEEAKRAKKYLESRSPHKIIIIGSGLTGVETACALVDRLDACICVLESKNRALPQFSANVSSFMERALAEKGIHLMLSACVREIEGDCMKLSDGSALDFDMAIWTAGIKPSPFVDRLAYPKKNDEWILTNSCLQAFDNVFALGDSTWIEVGGKVASKTAVEAEHQAKQTARNLWRYAEGKALKEYAMLAPTDSPVALISLGCDSAIGVYGSVCITMPSRVIHALKGWIDKSFIDHFK